MEIIWILLQQCALECRLFKLFFYFIDCDVKLLMNVLVLILTYGLFGINSYSTFPCCQDCCQYFDWLQFTASPGSTHASKSRTGQLQKPTANIDILFPQVWLFHIIFVFHDRKCMLSLGKEHLWDSTKSEISCALTPLDQPVLIRSNGGAQTMT